VDSQNNGRKERILSQGEGEYKRTSAGGKKGKSKKSKYGDVENVRLAYAGTE